MINQVNIHFQSERGFPLIHWRCRGQHRYTHLDSPIITVENYCKWYTLYGVTWDDKVFPITYDYLEEVMPVPKPGFSGDFPWHDHLPNPKAVELFADKKGWLVDDTSLDLIEYRWLHRGD